MAAAPQFAGSVSVVGGHDDDAVLVEATDFEKVEETAQAFVRLVDFISNPVAEPRPDPPVVTIHHGQIVAGKLMDILGLRIKEDRLLFAHTVVHQGLTLADGGTDFQLVPELLVGIELNQIVVRRQQLTQNLVVADHHLVPVDRSHLFQAVHAGKRLKIMRVQQHGPGPNGGFGERGASILRIDVVDYHAVFREGIEMGIEVYLGVVNPDIVLPKGVDHEDENVWTETVIRRKPIHKL